MATKRSCKCGRAVRRYSRTCDECQAIHELAYRARRAAGAIPPSLRAAVVARDGLTCRHCGCAVRRRRQRNDIARDTIEIDHVVPLNRGGQTTIANLVVSCMGCNRKKGDRAA